MKESEKEMSKELEEKEMWTCALCRKEFEKEKMYRSHIGCALYCQECYEEMRPPIGGNSMPKKKQKEEKKEESDDVDFLTPGDAAPKPEPDAKPEKKSVPPVEKKEPVVKLAKRKPDTPSKTAVFSVVDKVPPVKRSLKRYDFSALDTEIAKTPKNKFVGAKIADIMALAMPGKMPPKIPKPILKRHAKELGTKVDIRGDEVFFAGTK